MSWTGPRSDRGGRRDHSGRDRRRRDQARRNRRRRQTRRAGLVRLASLVIAIIVLVVLIVVLTGGGTSPHRASAAAPEVKLSRTTALSPAGVASVTVGAPLDQVQPVAAGFLGFSFEYYVIGEYTRNPDSPDPLFLQLVRGLNPGQQPNIRIGGDSTDWSYVPTSGVKKVKGFKVDITPNVVKSIAAVQKALNAKLELGISFEADSPALGANMAKALLADIPKSSIAALEIGNEPELYGALGWYGINGKPVYGRSRSYTLADYTREFNTFAKVLPSDLGTAGAASGSPKWDADVASFVKDASRLKMVTVHGYPMKVCGTKPGEANYPSISNMLAPSSSIGLVEALEPALKAAHAAGKPIRVDETNSVSCFGKAGVSNTFAAALWSIESEFRFARAGFDGVNFTTLPAAAYRLWTFNSGETAATVSPQYYGLVAFADAVPPGSKILATPNTGTNPQTFAVRTPSGATNVIVVNPGAARKLAVRVPNGGGGQGVATVLTAGSLTATSGTTLAGQSFGAGTANGDRTTTGELTGTAIGTGITPVRGAYVLSLPAHAAVTLTVGG